MRMGIWDTFLLHDWIGDLMLDLSRETILKLVQKLDKLEF